jgi:hypothetical protein
MSQFDSEFLIPLKFRMPPCVNQVLWHPCRKIISLVSKYCYNFAAGLPQNHSSYSKVLPIFFEALARGMPLVEDGEEVSEQQFFDTELYSITEFKDFDENVWREA